MNLDKESFIIDHSKEYQFVVDEDQGVALTYFPNDDVWAVVSTYEDAEPLPIDPNDHSLSVQYQGVEITHALVVQCKSLMAEE